MADERILNKQDHDFVFHFLRYRDIYRAAEKAHIAKNQAKKTYERIEIQEEIERQAGLVDRERARVQVEAEGITRAFLDTRLVQLINLDERTHAATVKGALELGYVRAGILQVGNTKSLDLTPVSPDDDAPLPTVYQALFTVGVTAQAAPLIPEAAHSQPTQPEPAREPDTAIHPQQLAPARAGRIKIL